MDGDSGDDGGAASWGNSEASVRSTLRRLSRQGTPLRRVLSSSVAQGFSDVCLKASFPASAPGAVQRMSGFVQAPAVGSDGQTSREVPLVFELNCVLPESMQQFHVSGTVTLT